MTAVFVEYGGSFRSGSDSCRVKECIQCNSDRADSVVSCYTHVSGSHTCSSDCVRNIVLVAKVLSVMGFKTESFNIFALL